MLAKIFFLILISLNLQADYTLNDTYYIKTDEVNLTSIIPHAKNDFNLFTIEKSRYSKRVKTKDLIQILKKHGYKNYNSKSNYTSFVIKSPIDTSKIEESIKNYYKSKYDQIDIQNITVEPRAYITALPENYTVNIGNREYLQRSGVVNIKTPDKKKIFFNYDITANVSVYVSKKNIKKDVELSAINSTKKSIILDKFRAKPIQSIEKGTFQSKHHISKDKLLTIRDLELLSIIKKDSFVNVSMYDDGMAISFSAKALQDGRVNDVIKVQQSNGKILKVRVVGQNRAEMR